MFFSEAVMENMKASSLLSIALLCAAIALASTSPRQPYTGDSSSAYQSSTFLTRFRCLLEAKLSVFTCYAGPRADGTDLDCVKKCARRIFALQPLVQLKDCFTQDCHVSDDKNEFSDDLPLSCISICARRSVSVTPFQDMKECIYEDCGLGNSTDKFGRSNSS